MAGRADLVRVFKQRAEAVQVIVSEAGSLNAAFKYAVELALKRGGSAIAAPGLSGKRLASLRKMCDGSGLKLVTHGLRDAGPIEVGFTVVDRGIAETGTLVLDSASEDVRIATMLSETHVAALPRAGIVPDAAALEGELERAFDSGPGYRCFISGASRTGDIERTLTVGVHGPLELHVVLLSGGKR